MPIEIEHQIPWGSERYRFHPWYERPLTERQVQACLVGCWSVAAATVVGSGIVVWLASWPVRWLAEPIMLLILRVLIVSARDVWSELCAQVRKDP